jgi:hypothetical protein
VNPVVQRGVHQADLAICGHIDPRRVGPHPYFLGLEGIQFLISRAADERPQPRVTDIAVAASIDECSALADDRRDKIVPSRNP